MKLVLCSEGFSTQEIIDATVRLCSKPQDQISVAIINEAYAVEEGDKRWVIDTMAMVASIFPSDIDIVDLLALPINEVEKRLLAKDIIFVIGGNSDYLMTVFRKTGFDTLLPKLLETKVYVGSSAGSMVMGRRISEAAYKLIYGEDSKYDVAEYLGLVDFSVMPHLDSPHFANRRESLLKCTSSFTKRVYGIRDDTAVVVDGGNVQVLGSEPVIIN